jgi:hypothetical protein
MSASACRQLQYMRGHVWPTAAAASANVHPRPSLLLPVLSSGNAVPEVPIDAEGPW